MELFASATEDPTNIDSNLDRFLRREEVEAAIGLKRSKLYLLIDSGNFPRPIKIGGASRWSLRAVKSWMDKQLSEAA